MKHLRIYARTIFSFLIFILVEYYYWCGSIQYDCLHGTFSTRYHLQQQENNLFVYERIKILRQKRKNNSLESFLQLSIENYITECDIIYFLSREEFNSRFFIQTRILLIPFVNFVTYTEPCLLLIQPRSFLIPQVKVSGFWKSHPLSPPPLKG